MGFLCEVTGLSLRDRVRSSVIRERLKEELLLLRIEKSQLRWFGHLVSMLHWMPPWKGVLGMSNWEETMGQA